jgi:hypothetical protein
MIHFTKKGTTLAISAAIALMGCQMEDPKILGSSNVEGIASDALIINGTVQAIHLDSGRVVSTTTTDEAGFYEFKNFQAPEGYYVLRLQGGEYVEEASGQRVILEADDFLEAIQFHKPGTDLGVAITPLTTISSAIAMCKQDQGQSIQSATNQASTEIAQTYGIDIHSTYPLNITDPANKTNSLSSGHSYGYIQAGRSEQVKQINEANGFAGHSQYTSIDLVRISYQDARYDCVLDGIGQSSQDARPSQLSMGIVDIDSNTYRADLGRNIIRAAASDYNKVGFEPVDLLSTANGIARSAGELFNYEDAEALDSEGPIVTWDLDEEQALNATFTMTATAEDFVGVKAATLYIDNKFYEEASDPSNIFFNVDTTYFTDGVHHFSLEVVDNTDNFTTITGTAPFDNTGPVVELISPEYANNAIYEVKVRVTDANGIASVKIDGVEASDNEDIFSRTINLSADSHVLDIVATDTMGELTVVSHTLRKDDVAPVLDVFAADARHIGVYTDIEQSLPLDHHLSDYAFIMDKTNYRLGSTPARVNDLQSGNIPYVYFEISDADTEWSTSKEELKLEYRVKIQDGIVVPWSSIPVSGEGFVIPFTVEFLSEYTLLTTLEDTVKLDVRLTDKAGNTDEFNWSSSLSMQLNKVNYEMDNLNGSELFGYRYIGARGGLLNMCTVANSSCLVAFVNDNEEIQAVVSSAKYSEPLNDESVDANSNIVGYSQYSGIELTDFISPFSSVFAGYFDAAYRIHEDFALAYSSAEASMIEDFGFNPMTTSPVDPASVDDLTAEAKHGLMLKVLSKNAFAIEGEFTADMNSVNLAWSSYRDLRDGVADGQEFGAVTRVGSEQYGHQKLTQNLGQETVNIAEEMGVTYLEDVVDYSVTLFTPIVPTVDIAFEAGEYKGLINITPVTKADSNLDYQLTFNGTAVGGNSSSYSVDTTLLNDGVNVVVITVTDRWGQVATDTVNLFIDNTPPKVTTDTNHLLTIENAKFEYSVEDVDGVGIKSVKIQGIETAEVAGKFSQVMNLKTGQNIITVTAEDTLGNLIEHEMVAVVLDELPNDYQGSFDFARTLPNGNLVTIIVDGTEIINPVSNRYTIDTEAFTDGLHDIEMTLTTVNGDYHSIELSDYTFDNHAPVIEQISSAITQDPLYNFQLDISDIGSEVVEVELDNLAPSSVVGTVYSRILPTRTGFTSYKVEATDRLGHKYDRNIAVARVANLAGSYKGELDLFEQTVPSNSWVELDVDGVKTVFIAGERVEIETADYGDGVKPVSISYTTANADTFESSLGNYIFDHEAPEITLTSNILTDSEEYTLSLSIEDTYSKIVRLEINEVAQDVTGNEGTITLSREVTLFDDVNTYEVEVEDAAGNVRAHTYTIVKYDNLNGLEFTSGEQIIFDATPSSGSEMSITLKVGESVKPTPTAGQSWSVDTASISDGEETFTVTALNEYGDTNEITKTVIVDNNAPAITITGDTLLRDRDYTFTVSSTDLASGLKTFTVDGVDVELNADVNATTQIIKEVTLATATTEFEVVVTDKLGNQRTQKHVVSVDEHAPELAIATSKGRVWNINTGAIEYHETFGASDLLYVQAQSFAGSAGGHVVDDALDDMWLSLVVSDPSDAANTGTSAGELAVEYRYVSAGTPVTVWSDGMVDEGNPGKFYLPLTSTYLSSNLTEFGGQKLQRVEFRVEDKAGNVTTGFKEFRFMVDSGNMYSTSESATNANGIEGLSIVNVESSIENQTREFGGVEFTNDYDEDVYIKVSDAGAAPVATLDRELWQRFNKGEYQRKKSYWWNWENGYSGSGSSAETVYWLNNDVWDTATWGKHGSSKNDDHWDISQNGNQLISSATTYSAAPYTHSANQSRTNDTQTTSWVTTGGKVETHNNYHPGGGTNSIEMYPTDHSTFNKSTGSMFFITTTASPVGKNYNQVAPLFTTTTAIRGHNRFDFGYQLHERWSSYTGYPKNEHVGNTNASWGLSVQGFVVYDKNGIVMIPTNGYVKVQKGQTVTIFKDIKFNPVTINESVSPIYEVDRYKDVGLTVQVDKSLLIRVVPANGESDTNLLDNMPFVTESFSKLPSIYGF